MTNARSPFPSQTADKFIIRLPEGMRDLIAEKAQSNNRTMNAEVVARLQSTFDTASAALPPLVDQAVKDEMEARGGSEADALLRLVLAGQSNGGQVLSIRIAPGMTLKEVSDAMNVMVKAAPNVGNVVVERE